MADVFDLQASISLDTSGFEASLAAALENAKRLSEAFRAMTADTAPAASGIKKVSDEMDFGSAKTEQATSRLDSVKDALARLSKIGSPFDGIFGSVSKNIQSLQNMRDTLSRIAHPISSVKSAVSDMAERFKYAGTSLSDWQEKAAAARKRVEELTEAYKRSAKETGETSEETKRLAEELREAIKELNRAEDDLNGYKDEVEKTGKEEEKTEEKTHKFANALGKVGSAAASAVVGLAKISAAGLTAAGAVLGKLASDSVSSYASYEQLEGGIQTLFGTGGKTIEEYAESVGKSVDAVRSKYAALEQAQTEMLKNADNAYFTAGLSANAYMETAIQFSASLIQGLNGDTKKAAKLTDQAIQDMSDNVNKMGTSMEMVQNTYRGLARQNYTMLDNLAIGYQGTAAEMARLINDSGVMGKAFKATEKNVKEISFDKYIEAIHVIQQQMGITGTTSEEAARTIEGSVKSMSAAWQNLKTNLASGDMTKISDLIDILASSIETAAGNIIPRVVTVLDSVSKVITKVAPMLADKLPALINSILPSFITAATNIIEALTNALPEITEALLPPLVNGIIAVTQALIKQLPAILNIITAALPQIIDAVTQVLPMLMQASMDILFALGKALVDNIPVLVPAIVDLVIQLADMLADNVDAMIDAAIAITLALANALTDQKTLDKLLNAIPRVITKICDVLAERAPEIVFTIIEVIATLAGAIVENLPVILDAIGQIIAALWIVIKTFGAEIIESLAGIGEELGFIIYDRVQEIGAWIRDKWESFKQWWKDAFESVGVWIYEALYVRIEKIKAILRLAWETIKETATSIWYGIRDVLWRVFDWIKEKFDKVGEIKDNFIEAFQVAIDYIKDLPDKALQWGKDLIDNFVGGIKGAAGSLWESVSGIASGIADFLGFSEPKKGALSRFHTFAPDMMELYASGIKLNADLVMGQVGNLTGNIANAFDSIGNNGAAPSFGDADVMYGQQQIVSDSSNANTSAANTAYSTYNVSINIDGYNRDPRELAEEIAGMLSDIENREMMKIGVVSL